MRKTSTYARKRAHQGDFGRKRHEVINPVTEAVIRSRIEEDIQRLRTAAGLQAEQQVEFLQGVRAMCAAFSATAVTAFSGFAKTNQSFSQNLHGI